MKDGGFSRTHPYGRFLEIKKTTKWSVKISGAFIHPP